MRQTTWCSAREGESQEAASNKSTGALRAAAAAPPRAAAAAATTAAKGQQQQPYAHTKAAMANSWIAGEIKKHKQLSCSGLGSGSVSDGSAELNKLAPC